ncbi:hypothetical protein TNCV_2526701 [Trichonephila clavipes]|nr:hypothetical protein TNCV_2526701 [Trichonephila clavipes]
MADLYPPSLKSVGQIDQKREWYWARARDKASHDPIPIPLGYHGHCMGLKARANDRRHLALCHDEFCGPRSGLCRSGCISNNNNFLCYYVAF